MSVVVLASLNTVINVEFVIIWFTAETFCFDTQVPVFAGRIIPNLNMRLEKSCTFLFCSKSPAIPHSYFLLSFRREKYWNTFHIYPNTRKLKIIFWKVFYGFKLMQVVSVCTGKSLMTKDSYFWPLRFFLF